MYDKEFDTQEKRVLSGRNYSQVSHIHASTLPTVQLTDVADLKHSLLHQFQLQISLDSYRCLPSCEITQKGTKRDKGPESIEPVARVVGPLSHP